MFNTKPKQIDVRHVQLNVPQIKTGIIHDEADRCANVNLILKPNNMIWSSSRKLKIKAPAINAYYDQRLSKQAIKLKTSEKAKLNSKLFFCSWSESKKKRKNKRDVAH